MFKVIENAIKDKMLALTVKFDGYQLVVNVLSTEIIIEY